MKSVTALLYAAALTLMATSVAYAQDVASTAIAAAGGKTEAQNSTSSFRNRIICKASLKPGSKIQQKKSCRTAREWADLKEQTQQQVTKMQQVGVKY